MKNNIKIVNGIIAVIIFSILFSNKVFSNNELMQAMRDEIARSMDLSIEKLQKPYYIEYTLKIEHSRNIKSTLGTITDSTDNLTAKLTVGLRVGDYKFDNTNFFDVGFSFFGSGDDEEGFKNRNVPIELDYKTFRRELWLATDAAYKQVSEVFAKKIATTQNRLTKDTTSDFLQLPPEKLYDTVSIPKFDMKYYSDMAKKISAVFENYPRINKSSITIEYLPETIYYVNSEGREYIKTSLFSGVEMAAITQATDGMPLYNLYFAYSQFPNELPNQDSLLKAAKEIAIKLDKMLTMPTLEDSYSGPILFEGQAAAELFAQAFAPNLVAQRQPLTEGGMQDNPKYAAFQSKIGGRVLPEFLSTNAVPDKIKDGNTPLVGHFKVDDDGVKTEEVNLVKDGYLKNLLSSRIPLKRIHKSNGHKRGGAPMLSNIELLSDKDHQKSEKELREQMLKLCKDRELPFGIIVKKVADQNIMYTQLFRLTAGNMSFLSRTPGKVAVIELYKIYPDGKEEMIRGCEVNGITAQSFKDILSVGNSHYTLNYLAPSVVSAYMTGGSQYIGTSMIVPDLLFEDGEIKPLEEDFPKPPVLENPITKK
jgi:TldD protein